MKIHNTGAKAQRGREILARKYAELCAFFKIKPLKPGEIAKLQNEQFYRLCEGTYGAQPTSRKHDYCEYLGIEPRRKPRAFKWFLHDLIKVYRATGARKAWLTLTAPFRYPAYLRRLDKLAEEARVASKSNHSEPDPVDTVNQKPELRLDK